jgi:hypothetical protein
MKQHTDVVILSLEGCGDRRRRLILRDAAQEARLLRMTGVCAESEQENFHNGVR